MVVGDIPRGIGQGQLAASGMLARMGAIVRRRHLSQPPTPVGCGHGCEDMAQRRANVATLEAQASCL